MYCSKCGKKLPDDSLFCTGCGCRLTENNAPPEPIAIPAPEVPAYQPVPVPQYAPFQQMPAPEKKKAPALLIIGLVLAIVACIFAFVYALALQSKNNEYISIIEDNQVKIGQLEREKSAAESELSDVKEELALINEEQLALLSENEEYSEMLSLFYELLEYIGSVENLGYSTENFHANRGIMVIDRMAGKQELKIFSTYYTNFVLDVDDESVVTAKWTDAEWTEKETQIYVTPVDYGITTITISNELYNNAFEVIVIVM